MRLRAGPTITDSLDGAGWAAHGAVRVGGAADADAGAADEEAHAPPAQHGERAGRVHLARRRRRPSLLALALL